MARVWYYYMNAMVCWYNLRCYEICKRYGAPGGWPGMQLRRSSVGAGGAKAQGGGRRARGGGDAITHERNAQVHPDLQVPGMLHIGPRKSVYRPPSSLSDY